MKTILIGIEQTLVLDQTGIGTGKDVKLSIVGEDGEYIFQNLVAVYDSTLTKYKVTLTVPETESPQYIRLFWFSTDVTIEPKYYPEDAYLDKNVIQSGIEVVPYSYFKEFFLNVRGNLDSSHQSIIDGYLSDPKGLQSQILAAMGDMELELEMYIAPRTVMEERDNYLEKLSQNFWQFVVSYPPIIELINFKFRLGNRDMTEIDNKMFTINEQMGIIEFLPYPTDDSQGAFSYMIASMAGYGVALHTAGGYERIPNMFYVEYKSGIFTKDQDRALKESIRTALCKKTLRNIIELTDPKRMIQSRSESKDGVSASESYGADKLIEAWKKEEQSFIFNLRKRYGKNVNVAMLS